MEEKTETNQKSKKTLIIILTIIGIIILISIVGFIIYTKVIKNEQKELDKKVNNIIDNSSNTDNVTTDTKYYEDENYLVSKNDAADNLCAPTQYKIFDKNKNEDLEFTYENNGDKRTASITGFIKDNETYYVLLTTGSAGVTTTIKDLKTNEDIRSINGAVTCENNDICYFSSCPSTVIKLNKGIWSPKLESIDEYHNQDEHHISKDKNYTYILKNNTVYALDNNDNFNIISTHKFENVLDSDDKYYLVYENNNLNIYQYDGELITIVKENTTIEGSDYLITVAEPEISIYYKVNDLSETITYNLDDKKIVESN